MWDDGPRCRQSVKQSIYELSASCIWTGVKGGSRCLDLVLCFTNTVLVMEARRGTLFSWVRSENHDINSEMEHLGLLRATLQALYDALGDPDFNYVVHTAPIEDEIRPC